MKSDRIMRSKIYRFLDYVLRLIILNALIIIPSFSFFIIFATLYENNDHPFIYLTLITVLFWFFPSIVSCTDVIKQYETNETNTIFKDFFKSLKKNYLKSFILSIIIAIMIVIFYNSFNFFMTYANKGFIYILGLLLIIPFVISAAMILIHIPLVMAYFKNLMLKEIVKLSCIMAFKDILNNILIVLIVSLLMSLNIALYFVMAIGGISIPIYIAVKLSFKKYIKIYRKVEKEDE